MKRVIIQSLMLSSLLSVPISISWGAAPTAGIGTFGNGVTVEGLVLQAGASVGGNTQLETSIGTLHGDSQADAGASFSPTVAVKSGILGVSLVNAGAAVAGDLCAKVSVASLGASTCTYSAP